MKRNFAPFYPRLPPKNKCAIETSTTAPTVAAASEYKNVLSCTIPSFVKIHPPTTDPINPKRMSPMHPKPRPRASFPASHPAINPRIIHPSRLRPGPTCKYTSVSRAACSAMVASRVIISSPSHPAAGSCCVMQCNVPRPNTRSRQCIPATSRSGNNFASVFSATRSFASLNVGTITIPFAI